MTDLARAAQPASPHRSLASLRVGTTQWESGQRRTIDYDEYRAMVNVLLNALAEDGDAVVLHWALQADQMRATEIVLAEHFTRRVKQRRRAIREAEKKLASLRDGLRVLEEGVESRRATVAELDAWIAEHAPDTVAA